MVPVTINGYLFTEEDAALTRSYNKTVKKYGKPKTGKLTKKQMKKPFWTLVAEGNWNTKKRSVAWCADRLEPIRFGSPQLKNKYEMRFTEDEVKIILQHRRDNPHLYGKGTAPIAQLKPLLPDRTKSSIRSLFTHWRRLQDPSYQAKALARREKFLGRKVLSKYREAEPAAVKLLAVADACLRELLQHKAAAAA